jgi:7-cyano-7-deazaguanine reductase
MTDIKEIAGRHLGRTMAGESMTPYIAPKIHDAGLLVPIPREYGRAKSGISTPMLGADIWHAYEFSFLLQGVPRTGVLKFSIPVDSTNMIESKSFKLYLNSFDFEDFESVASVIAFIKNDISSAAGGDVNVDIHTSCGLIDNLVGYVPNGMKFIKGANKGSIDIAVYADYRNDISFDESINHLNTLTPSTLNRSDVQYFHTSNLRSACEITNQKDTGHAIIAMMGSNNLDREEVAHFIFSMRDSQHFHENVTEIMYDRLHKHYSPDELLVMNIYNRRGGLDIHPIRYSSHLFAAYIDVAHYLKTDNLYRLTSQS